VLDDVNTAASEIDRVLNGKVYIRCYAHR
jgi:hypothetical protein